MSGPAGAPGTRREQILAIAAELFAQRGFHGVSVAELGAACGVSGPALYKHFRSKDAMLAEMLVSISEDLLRVAHQRLDGGAGLEGLVDWHVTFALANRPLIVVQDRDWSALPATARERVRTLQREYVDLWAAELGRRRPELDHAQALVRVHAVFGLLNSTPRSALLPEDQMRDVLTEMSLRSLLVDGPHRIP